MSLDSQSPAAPCSTAISDSRQFVRRYAPSNCVRCCDSRSLATARDVRVLQRTRKAGVYWRFYCTPKRLPIVACPVELGIVESSVFNDGKKL